MQQQRFVRASDGTRLYTTHQGEGTAVVLCDGIGCAGFIWRYLREALGQHVRVITWHYRGHGLSDTPQDLDSLSMPVLRRDLIEVLDAYGIDKAVLVGHSMGAQLAFDVATHAPERTLGLIPVCGTYGRPLDTFHGNANFVPIFSVLRRAMLRWPGVGQRIWERCFNARWVYRLARAVAVNGDLTRDEDLLPYFDHLRHMSGLVFMRLLENARHHCMYDRLDQIAVPTLVVAGARDHFTPPFVSAEMHRRIPNSRMLLVPEGTHILPIELPALLMHRVSLFLRQHHWMD